MNDVAREKGVQESKPIPFPFLLAGLQNVRGVVV
jgi:hypothetical protein